MYHGEKIPGFPAHPHRGFETITIVEKGVVDHFDSSGSTGRYSNGDVQWMTAGSGLQHSEMFPLLNEDKENPLELFQIWLNLPKAKKFCEPNFKMLWSEKIPILNLESASVKLIAGSFDSIKSVESTPDSWAANSENNLVILLISIDKKGTFTIPKAESNLNRSLYFYKGTSSLIQHSPIKVNHSMDFDFSEDIVIENGETPAKFLFLQSKPISEPVVQYGPFVMNSNEEIEKTFQDFRKTQFGGWSFPTREPTSPKESGRFAKYSDGRIDLP
jgi:quercetin 2,3-dioxygenase